MVKPLQTMTIQLNSERQECKTGPIKRRIFAGGKGEWKG
jgi:hypothetical protein